MISVHGKEKVNLLLGGDLMLGRGVNHYINKEDYKYPFEQLIFLTKGADLFFVNLECSISPKDQIYSGRPKAFYFRADPVAAKTLKYAGIDYVSLANNHALDSDYKGLADTISILSKNDIHYSGAGKNINDAGNPAEIEKNGIKISVLSYCDHQNDFAAKTNLPGINFVDITDDNLPEKLSDEVKILSSNSDHVIISFHWMPNWVDKISSYYRDLAKKLVDAGASIIWGHSPHHFLGVEWIGEKIIIYSAGDLVDDYAVNYKYRNDRSLLFNVTLNKNEIEKVSALPIELDFARTFPARNKSRDWIVEKFTNYCKELGTNININGQWLEVSPSDSLKRH